MTPEDRVPIAALELKLRRLTVERAFTVGLLRDLYVNAEVDVRLVPMLDAMVVELRAWLFSKEHEAVEVAWPADWWQAFKARWFPAWAKRRWPIRFERHRLNVTEYAPLIPRLQPGDRMYISYLRAERHRLF